MTLTQVTKAGLHDIALDHVFTIGASGTDHYTFQGEGLNGTVNDPTLYLTRGKTYRFENGSGGHPIRIQSTSGASGTAYNTGVTNNAGSGTVIVEVQHDAPDVLYYQCTSHANMNGVLYITGALADGGVTTAKLAADAVDGTKIADDAIANEHLSNPCVQTENLSDNAVTTAKIANTAIITNKIATSAVTTNRIADGAVINGKLATDAVTTAKIANSAITNSKLGDDCVTGSRMADNAVATEHITDGSVTNDKIAGSTITSAKIANNTIVDADINSSAAIGRSKLQNIISNNAENRVITGTNTANLVNGESGLIYDGSNGRLGVNASSGADARLSVVDDSNNEGFNVKHSNLTAGIGIGYSTIQATGSNTNNPLVLHSKGTGNVNIACQSNTVASVEGASRDFRIHGNTQGWSTLQMDDQNYNWRKHIRRVNNGANSVSTHSIARIKRTNWGWGYFEIRIYSTYYYGSYVSIGYIMGHGNGGDHYSINRKKEIWTNNNSIGWGAEITKGSASSSSPGQSSAHYFDLKITLPNYTYSTVEFIAYSGYKQSDSDMANVLDSYRLFSP